MLGLIGSHFLTHISDSWFPNKCRGCVRQGHGYGKSYRVSMFCQTEPNDMDRNVVAVDGLWMVIKRDLFDLIRFDSTTYKGFHFYDMDICMQVLQTGYKIRIADKIDVEHKSPGDVDAQYYKNCIQFHKKWNANLPVLSSIIPQETMWRYETVVMDSYFHRMASYYEQKKMLNSFLHRIATKIYIIWNKWN